MAGDDLIVKGWPPNIADIRRAFPAILSMRGVIFAYHPYIFVPDSDPNLHPALIAHEMIHLDHQAQYPGGPDQWWQDYIHNPEFRLYEEIRAHYAEFRWHVVADGRRKNRRKQLAIIAGRLSSAQYGNMVSLEVAKLILLKGPDGHGPTEDAEGDDGDQGDSGSVSNGASAGL